MRHVAVAVAGHGVARHGLLEGGEVVGGELDVERHRRSPRGSAPAWCRGSARRSSPCASTQASASWPGVQSLAAAISRDLVDQREVGVEGLALEAREVLGPAAVRSPSAPRSRGDGAGEQSATERGVGHQADAELAQDGRRISSSRSRVKREYSVWRAVIGCTRGPGGWWPPRPRRARGGAPCRPRRARPWRRRSPRSGPSCRRGAGSRGRCGRRRAAASEASQAERT